MEEVKTKPVQQADKVQRILFWTMIVSAVMFVAALL